MQPERIITKIIDTFFDETIIRICNRLQKIAPSHYEIIDFERHQEREEEFLRLLQDSFEKQHTDKVKEYMNNLAALRSKQGYAISEVQQAIDIIEEELWHTLINSGEDSQQVISMLYECHQLFTLIRNEFACAFVESQTTMQKYMTSLKERFYSYRQNRQDVPE